MPLTVYGHEYPDFDSAVAGVMKNGNYSANVAKKIVGKAKSEQEAQIPNEEPLIGPLRVELKKNNNSLDDQGQPNIIDYTNHEPLLFTRQDRAVGGPGVVLLNNEPSSRSPMPLDGYRPGPVYDKSTFSQSGNDITTLPGAMGEPQSKPNFVSTENQESFNEDDHPRAPEGSSNGGEFIGKSFVSDSKEISDSLRKRGLKGDDLLDQEDKAAELLDNEAKINKDGTVTVYHYTSKEARDSIRKTGKMVGKEDGIFFTTKPDGEAKEFGDAVIKANIPIEMLEIDDEFGDEVHLRIPTDRPGAQINVKKYLNQESFDPINNSWPVGVQNPDHGTCCQNQMYQNNGPTLIHQATPQFTKRESDIGIGKENPDNTDRNIVERGSQAFSDFDDPERTIRLKLVLQNPNKFDFEESPAEWRESDIPREDSFDADSSVVGHVQYFPEEKTMMIELNGNQYPYYNIEYRDFDSFKGSPSKGAAYNRMFKGNTAYFSPQTNQEALKHAIEFKESLMIDSPNDFDWIDEAQIQEMISEGKNGTPKFILIKAAEPTVTDHRAEGEDYQRVITPEILKKLTYTAIKKGSDLNHMFPKKNPSSGIVADAEFNDKTGFSEFLYFETDPEILRGIKEGFITAVSINGGAARSYKIINGQGQEVENPQINCSTGECYRIGEGIILGERDDIAFTWVVTKPNFNYYGRVIPPTVPGIKTTRIFVLE